MKRNCQPEYCKSEFIKSKQCTVLLILISHKKPSMVQLSGLALPVPITNDDNAKFKLENERNYHLLSKAAFAWIWKCRREELVFVIIHSWQMIINSDRVVYNQSREFSVPEDKLSQGAAQGELSSRWRSWDGKSHHPCRFLAFISCNTHLNINLAYTTYLIAQQMQQKPPVWVYVILLCAAPFLSSHLCVSLRPVCLHDESRGDAGVSLKKNKSLVEAALQCGSKWQPEGSWRMAAGMRATQTAFLYNITRQLWKKWLQGQVVLTTK